jgi:hypothetical protein
MELDALEAAYLTVHCVDWAQTRQIAQEPQHWRELNPAMPEHPTTGQVNRYFLLTAAAHITVSSMLPERQRKVWQYLTIGVEAGIVGRNYSIGLTGRF